MSELNNEEISESVRKDSDIPGNILEAQNHFSENTDQVLGKGEGEVEKNETPNLNVLILNLIEKRKEFNKQDPYEENLRSLNLATEELKDIEEKHKDLIEKIFLDASGWVNIPIISVINTFIYYLNIYLNNYSEDIDFLEYTIDKKDEFIKINKAFDDDKLFIILKEFLKIKEIKDGLNKVFKYRLATDDDIRTKVRGDSYGIDQDKLKLELEKKLKEKIEYEGMISDMDNIWGQLMDVVSTNPDLRKEGLTAFRTYKEDDPDSVGSFYVEMLEDFLKDSTPNTEGILEDYLYINSLLSNNDYNDIRELKVLSD